MTTGDKAAAAARLLLTGLEYKITEAEEDGVLTMSSEDSKFKLAVHCDENGNFEKYGFVDTSDGALGKLDALIDALSGMFVSDTADKAEAGATEEAAADGSDENKEKESAPEKKEEDDKKEDSAKNEDESKPVDS